MRIKLGGALESTHCFAVIERIDQGQSLIEEFLRFRVRRRNRVMERAQVRLQRGGLSDGAVLVLRRER